MLLAECESLAHGFAHEAGAFAVVRWHVLSGSSLALTQYTGGRVTIQGGTRTLLRRDRRRRAVRDAALDAGGGGRPDGARASR